MSVCIYDNGIVVEPTSSPPLLKLRCTPVVNLGKGSALGTARPLIDSTPDN